MADSTLIISFSSASGSNNAPWVKLEQIVPTGPSSKATLKDVYTLWMAAATGNSARLVRSRLCPVAFTGSTLTLYLGFYAWPSTPDLAYQLNAALGEISGAQRIGKARSFSLFLNNQASVDLGYYLEDLALAWETPIFDRYGSAIPEPTWELVDGTRLQFSVSVFGAVRITGTAIGYHYTCEMSFDKPVTEVEDPVLKAEYQDQHAVYNVKPLTVQNSAKIENIDNTITAAWLVGEETQTEQLRLTIPDCVKSLLEMCPDSFKTLALLCENSSPLQVYYNACDGSILTVIEDYDETNNFCTDITGKSGLSVGPWGGGIE